MGKVPATLGLAQTTFSLPESSSLTSSDIPRDADSASSFTRLAYGAEIGEADVTAPDGKTGKLGDFGLAPLVLTSKAGLSLINGTHVHTGLAALALRDAAVLAKAADIACAMAVEAMLCSVQPFRADVHALRPQRGQAASAANITRLVAGSALVQSRETTLVLGVMRGYVAWAMAFLCAVAVLVFLYCAWRDARRPLDAPEEVHGGAL